VERAAVGAGARYFVSVVFAGAGPGALTAEEVAGLFVSLGLLQPNSIVADTKANRTPQARVFELMTFPF
jgi:hypothetical protein